MPLRLEVFSEADDRTVVTDLGSLEESRLKSYEQGYGAGWDDAVAAQSHDQSRLRAELAHNLQSLAFTYHEARAHVLRAIEPLFDTMLTRILPDLARQALVPRILAILRPLAAVAAEAPILITVAPAARAAVEAALADAPALPVTIEEEETLGEGQAFLRLGATETHIDLDRAVAEITTAVRGFFDLNGETTDVR